YASKAEDDDYIAQNKTINNLYISTNTTMKNPRNNSQNKNWKTIIKKTKDLNSILQPKKTQDRQIIIDSNNDKSESDSSDIPKTLKINAYDTINILYNKNEIEENDRKKENQVFIISYNESDS
ncbi:11873_t:CDS:2, partial [Funneliformis geosporum]